MVKYIAFAVIVVVIALVSYMNLQHAPERTELPTVQKTTEGVEAPVETPVEETKIAPAVEKKSDIPEIPEKMVLETKPEVKTDLLHAQEEPEGVEDEEMEEEDETPTVKRSQLIGGANVEWVEPKPKDESDKFGQPPGW
jgi:hypothetical protein